MILKLLAGEEIVKTQTARHHCGLTHDEFRRWQISPIRLSRIHLSSTGTVLSRSHQPLTTMTSRDEHEPVVFTNDISELQIDKHVTYIQSLDTVSSSSSDLQPTSSFTAAWTTPYRQLLPSHLALRGIWASQEPITDVYSTKIPWNTGSLNIYDWVCLLAIARENVAVLGQKNLRFQTYFYRHLWIQLFPKI